MVIGLLAMTPAVAAQDGATQDGAIISVALDGSGDHDSIAAAIDAATDGDTILIAPGTYDEVLVIDEDIRLVGDGDRADVIVSPTAERIDEAVSAARFEDRIPFAVRVTGAAPTFAGLSLDMPPETGVTLIVTGGDPTVIDVSIDGAESLLIDGEPTFRDAHIDTYFAVRGASPTVEDSELTGHASVDGPGRTVIRGSILHDGTSASADAVGAYEDNHVLGVALEVDTGSDMLVSGNLVEGVQGSPAIEVRDPGSSAQVIGNTVRDSVIGIAVDSDEPGSTVSGNTIEDVRIGIHVDSESSVVVEDNTIESTTRGIVLEGDGPRITGNVICGEGAAIDIRHGSPAIGSNQICEALEP